MEAFLNDTAIKERALADLTANPIGKDGIDYANYEPALGIPKELGQWEDIIFEELSPESAQTFPREFLEAIPVGADLSIIPARLMLWQWEDKKLGLSTIGAVQKDKDLIAFCEELASLYRREIAGTPITPEELQKLSARIMETWARVGDRERIARMAFARKWAWAGARKWAWIPTKGWSGAWKWVQAGVRGRNRSAAALMLLSWADAWKWMRPWESRATRVATFRSYILKTLAEANRS